MESVKDLNKNRRSVRVVENVIGPMVENFVGSISVSFLIVLIKMLMHKEVGNMQWEILIGCAIFCIINIIRFLVLDEGIILAYKFGVVSSNLKNNVVNATANVVKDNNLIEIEILDCAKAIIRNQFTGQGIDFRTLNLLGHTRTNTERARDLLIKAKIITVENNKTKFLVDNPNTAKNALVKFIEGK